jgi:hypothetical protein
VLIVGGQARSYVNVGDLSMANIAAPDLFGAAGPSSAPDFVSDDPLCAIIIYPWETPVYVYSDLFQITQGETFLVPEWTFSQTPPPFPDSIFATSLDDTLDPGQTTQLQVIAILADGMAKDVTAGGSGTTYRTSNPLIADVDNSGLVTAQGNGGAAFITATNNAATSVVRIDVVPQNLSTTIQGFTKFEDGTTAIGVDITAPFGGTSVSLGPDGFFSFPLTLPSSTPYISVRGSVSVGNADYAGSSTSFNRHRYATGVAASSNSIFPQCRWAANLLCHATLTSIPPRFPVRSPISAVSAVETT